MLATAFESGDRHGARIALRVELKESILGADAPEAWVHVTVDGSYKGHSQGEFSFDEDTHSQIIANFEGRKNPIVVHYGHPDSSKNGEPTPTAGWVRALETRADGLWALVEFTTRAAKLIRSGELAYCSIEVLFDSTDRKTGEPVGAEMVGLGLTNDPFIDGQKQIHLTRERMAKKKKSDVVKLQDMPTEETVLPPSSQGAAAIENDIIMALTKVTGLDSPALLAWIQENAATLAGMMGMQAEGKEDEEDEMKEGPPKEEEKVETTADEGAAPAIPAGGVPAQIIVVPQEAAALERDRAKATAERVIELERRVATFEEKDRLREIEDAIREGRALDTDRDNLIALGRKDAELMRKFMSKQIVPSPERLTKSSEPAPNEALEISDDDPVYKAMLRNLSWRKDAESVAKAATMEFHKKQADKKPAGRQ